MTCEEFIKEVSDRAGVPKDRAEELTGAVLTTLADRLTAGEADDVASQLPKGLKEKMLSSTPEAEPLELDDFVRLVATRSEATQDEAPLGVQAVLNTLRNAIQAVLNTLRNAISAGEFRDMMAQLPDDFRRLVEAPASIP